MLKRKITKIIEDWYNNSTNALLIDGARQIGKTTVVEQFLLDSGLDYVEINLLENQSALDAFNTSKNVDELLLRLTVIIRKKITPNKTIIFIDEIQEAKDALTPIKFLVQNSSFRFIFSGSLLGVKIKEISSVPVGFLQIEQMYPMDFEEFIIANGVSERTIKYLQECFLNYKSVDSIVHDEMMSLFNTYLVVGGMPKAVLTFIQSKNISKVNQVLRDIDAGYKVDIAKYEQKHKLLIQDIYDLIPSELNNANKRFILKNLNENARFYKYETSFAWLKNSGVGLFVHNVDNPVFPLLASKERTLFKLFLCDIGILTFKLFHGNQIEILNGNSNLNFGAIYEAVVAQELKAHNFDLYYNSNKKRGEIDFLIEKNNKVIPIEVKSGKDYKRHSSLNNMMNNNDFNYEYAYVLNNSNLKVINNIIYLPIYMSMFINNDKTIKDQIIQLSINNLM